MTKETSHKVATIAGALLHIDAQELARRCSTEDGRKVLADEIQAIAASALVQTKA